MTTDEPHQAVVTVHSWTPSRAIRRTVPRVAGDATAPGFAWRDPSEARGRVRLGLVSNSLGQNGCSIWQLTLLKALDPARFVWIGCADAAHLPQDRDILAAHQSLIPVAQGSSEAVLSLASQCDVLIAWGIPGLARAIKSLPRPPVLIAFDFSARFSGLAPGTSAELADLVDAWVPPSELAALDVPAGPHRNVRVIWNAVDPTRLLVSRSRAAMRASWGVPEGSLVAGYLGRLSPDKGGLAMARLAESLPEPWHAVVVGEGTDLAALKARASGLDRLHAVGPDLAAGDVLSAFDVLLVVSESESFGLALAEAIVLGIPVVSTDVGIARLVEGLTRLIPFGADGPTLARAVLDAHDSGRSPIARDLIPRLLPERFGREWTELIETTLADRPTVAPARPSSAIDPAVRDAVNRCPHRGPEGGLVLTAAERERSCCGGGPELTACAAGKGQTPGRVTLRDCLACGGVPLVSWAVP